MIVHVLNGIRLAIEHGIRCVEHGNLLDAETAVRMAELGATLVPTLVTYQAMAEIGAKVGLPERNVTKNAGVFKAGQRSIEIARDVLAAGNPIRNRLAS